MQVCPQCGQAFGPGAQFCSRDGTPLSVATSPDDLNNRVLGGRFRIIRRLGGGTFGDVFLAEQVSLGRECALKILNPSAVSEQAAQVRFVREARAAASIRHPNVVTIYDFGIDDSIGAFIAMEYVDGDTLSAYTARRGKLVPTEALHYVTHMASGLAAAHKLGIVHRDLKPDNMLLANRSQPPHLLKIADFGLARPSDTHQLVTPTGAIPGTPLYLSPEQLEGEQASSASDVYALGLIAFELLTGHFPFSGGGWAPVWTRLTTEPMTLSEADPLGGWPPQLEGLIARSLHRNPTQRFATASDFLEATEAILAALSPRAHVPTGGAWAHVLSSAYATQLYQSSWTFDEAGVGRFERRLIGIHSLEEADRIAVPFSQRINSPAGRVYRPAVRKLSPSLTEVYLDETTLVVTDQLAQGSIVIDGFGSLRTVRTDLALTIPFENIFDLTSSEPEVPATPGEWRHEYVSAALVRAHTTEVLSVAIEFPASFVHFAHPPYAIVFATLLRDDPDDIETARVLREGSFTFKGRVAQLLVPQPLPGRVYAISWSPPSSKPQ